MTARTAASKGRPLFVYGPSAGRNLSKALRDSCPFRRFRALCLSPVPYGIEEKTPVSRHQKHKLFQQFLVAATSLCVGVILARAMGF
jgi:hypothetical protein